MADYNVALTGNSRVFMIEGRASPDHEPDYMACVMAGAPSQSFGDVTIVECQSPDEYGSFDTIAEYFGPQEPFSMSLTGRYALDVASDLLRIAKRGCETDVQIHFGQCQDPSSFNDFSKALILEVARLTNWSAGDLGALSSDQNAVVDESTDLSGRRMYEVLPLSAAERDSDVVHNPLEDVVICSKAKCGDECDDEDDGCEIIFAVGDSGAGSPGTAPDLIWSDDGGLTLNADDINTLDAAENADALACVDTYVVVVSFDDGALHYKTKTAILAGTAGGWTRTTEGGVAGGLPINIWSVGLYAFLVGANGTVYGFSNPIIGMTVLDEGEATEEDLLGVHALDKLFAVAVGENNSVIYTKTQDTWEAVDGPAGGAGDNNTCVWCKDKQEWWIGNDAGEIYYTLDGGDSWVEMDNVPVTFTGIDDIQFSTDSVGYIAGTITGPVGVVLRTFDGGYSWVAIPEGVGTLPDQDGINAIAACPADPNFVVMVGFNVDDGFFAIAQD
jgi:hypothetical protein